MYQFLFSKNKNEAQKGNKPKEKTKCNSLESDGKKQSKRPPAEKKTPDVKHQ
jgi:hypothetical protein